MVSGKKYLSSGGIHTNRSANQLMAELWCGSLVLNQMETIQLDIQAVGMFAGEQKEALVVMTPSWKTWHNTCRDGDSVLLSIAQ